MSAHIYARVSKKSDVCDSHPAQIQECKNYCIENNIPIKQIYNEFSSARKTNNTKSIEKIIQKMEKGDILIIYCVDRFCRNTKEALILLEDMEKKGLNIYSIYDKISYNTSSNKILFRTLLNFAEYESDRMSDRQKKASQYRIERRMKERIGHGKKRPRENEISVLTTNIDVSNIIRNKIKRTDKYTKLIEKLNIKSDIISDIENIYDEVVIEDNDGDNNELEKNISSVQTSTPKYNLRSRKN
jgi:DNA invertase Pin-like site-specific DNA recombinase